MRNAILILILSLGLVPAASAQGGVSPVIQNLHANKKGIATGSFRVLNRSLTDLAVTFQPRSLSWSRDGKMTNVRPLDNGISVQLSETSALVPIRSERAVSFKAICMSTPCYFDIFSVMRPVRKSGPGVSIAAAIGEGVYVCRSRVEHCREDYWTLHGGLPKGK